QAQLYQWVLDHCALCRDIDDATVAWLLRHHTGKSAGGDGECAALCGFNWAEQLYLLFPPDLPARARYGHPFEKDDLLLLGRSVSAITLLFCGLFNPWLAASWLHPLYAGGLYFYGVLHYFWALLRSAFFVGVMDDGLSRRYW